MVRLLHGVEIKPVREHYEAFRGNQFIVSGDTLEEVVEELKTINYNQEVNNHGN